MQSINFYLDEYHPKPLSFDSRFALVTLLVLAFSLSFFGWLQITQIKEQKAQLASKKLLLEQQKSQLLQVTNKLKSHTNMTDWQEQLKQKQFDLKSYQEINNFINVPFDYTPIAFSQIFSDLALHSVDSLWLTNINIQSDNLSLNGSTTEPNAIPIYVTKLAQTNSLKRQFDELLIERSPNKQIINFKLINGRTVNEK